MEVASLKQRLSSEQLVIHQQEFESRRKSMKIAVLIWFFLGTLGGHQFYMGNIKKGILVLLSTIVLYGGAMLFVGAFFVQAAEFGANTDPYATTFTAQEMEQAESMLGQMGLLFVSLFIIFIIWVVQGILLKKNLTKVNEKIEKQILQQY